MVQRFIGYERVSTARQGQSGLGMAAQRKAIKEFAASRGAEVIAWFTEVESGKNANRPELVAAIRLARLTGATLVIAKLDRLSRNAAFLLTLRDSGVRFLAVDMPEANDLTVGIMALVASAGKLRLVRIGLTPPTGLLVFRLHCDKPHGRAQRGFDNSLSIRRIILLTLDERLHIDRRDQAHIVSQLLELATPAMCRGASLHGDNAPGLLGNKCQNLTPGSNRPV